jgi:hypothetical protein
MFLTRRQWLPDLWRSELRTPLSSACSTNARRAGNPKPALINDDFYTTVDSPTFRKTKTKSTFKRSRKWYATWALIVPVPKGT